MTEQPDFNVLTEACPSRMRFGALRNTVQGISPKVLTDTLRDLERDGSSRGTPTPRYHPGPSTN